MSSTGSKNRQILIAKLQYLGQMSSTETALFHQKAAESIGLGITDIKAVTILLQEGKMTAGEIAQRLMLTTGAVTNLLDRLERKDIIHREADPKDRRKVLVSADPKSFMGTAASDAYESMGEAYAHLLSQYTIDTLNMLVDYHEKQIAITKQEITKLSTK